eukprot:m.38617 g.38617  ORF g.38617 m.38617 type:complete len:464 (+) comp7859_c0_seq1:166-1557(+)
MASQVEIEATERGWRAMTKQRSRLQNERPRSHIVHFSRLHGRATALRAASRAMRAGRACERGGDLTRALWHYSTAAAQAPGHSAPHMAAGGVHQTIGLNTGRFSAAAAAFSRACRCDPTNPDAWHALGCAQFLRGRFRESAAAHARAAQLLHTMAADPAEVAEEIVTEATSGFHGAGDEETGLGVAIEAYDRALAVCPGHSTAGTQRAAAFWRLVHLQAVLLHPFKHKVVRPYKQYTLPAAEERGGSAGGNPLHTAHCVHWASAAECADVIAAAEAAGRWDSARHSDYPTVDIEVSTVRPIHEWFVPGLQTTVLPTMAKLFEIAADRLIPRDVFVVKYSGDGRPGLPLHRDSCTLSFNVQLSDPEDFRGGGTRLESLGVTIRPSRVGDVLLHSGQMLHGGECVSRGVRYILVGFVEVAGASGGPSVREQIAEENRSRGMEDDPDDPTLDHARLKRYWDAIQGV